MANDGTITVDSSPTEVLNKLTPAQHKKWRETGDLPAPQEAPEDSKEPKTETADSSPAAKTEVAEPPAPKVEGEKPAESAPANTEPKAPKKHLNAEDRIKQLLSENKRLEAELAKSREKPAAPAAKKEEAVAKPRRADVDPKTGQPKFATDEAYEEALDKWMREDVTKTVRSEMTKAQEEARVAEQNRLVQQKWQNSLKIAVERHPDFAKVVEVDDKGAFQNAELKAIKTNGVLDAFILDSPIGGQLLYYLASHKGEVARIDGMSPFAAARELTKLEDKLSSAAPAAEPPKKEEKAEGDGSPAPKISSAPAPPTSISGKGTAPINESNAAVAAGDFKRYQQAENAELARKRKAS